MICSTRLPHWQWRFMIKRISELANIAKWQVIRHTFGLHTSIHKHALYVLGRMRPVRIRGLSLEFKLCLGCNEKCDMVESMLRECGYGPLVTCDKYIPQYPIKTV